MTFPTEEQGREARQAQEEQEPGPEEQGTPALATGEQKVEALLTVHEAISGMMAAQVENPAMAYRAILADVAARLTRSDMPMVCNLIDAGASSPEALASAKAEVIRLIILGSILTAEHKASGRAPARRRGPSLY